MKKQRPHSFALEQFSPLHYWGKKHLTPTEIVFRILAFLFFAAVSFSYLYLIFWCFYSGTRDHVEFAKDPFGFSSMHFDHYGEVFEKIESNGTSFFGMILNSVYFSFLGPLICIFVSCRLAYTTSKYKFFGSGLIYLIIIVVITLPIYGSQSSMYRLLFQLGWLNSRLMLLTSINGFTIWYLYFYGFFKSVSWTYAEAAKIDGANPWQIYYRIMFPQALPMFGALFLMLWVADWNSYGTALIYLPKMPTLAVGIYQFQTLARYNNRMDLLYAACALSMLPPLILFVFCNKALMSNVSIGGIKE
ncbi:MAG: carbohydrate ABC transporter permease [Erysipelotrichaceae bacterium]|nr:carbohydrate ABC transporter permease [Erysipelotrichaceae bacterium]